MNAIEHNLAEFNGTLQDYIRDTGKTPQEAVLKQGSKLGFALSYRLGSLKPKRGSIREERLAALGANEGVRVRPSVRADVFRKNNVVSELGHWGGRVAKSRSRLRFVRGKELRGSLLRKGKRLNFWALAVQRELRLREGGIGYLGLATRVSGINRIPPGKRERWFGRYRQQLAEAGLSVQPTGASLEIRFGGEKVDAGEGLSKPRQKQAIAQSLKEVSDDMRVYLVEQYAERWRLRKGAKR